MKDSKGEEFDCKRENKLKIKITHLQYLKNFTKSVIKPISILLTKL